MTRLNWDRMKELTAMMRQRAALHNIPENAGRDAFLAHHDALVAEGVTTSRMRERMAEVEPTGVDAMDFAVPAYFDSVYVESGYADVPELTEAREAWVEARQAGEHDAAQFRNTISQLGPHAPELAGQLSNAVVDVDGLRRVDEHRALVLTRAEELVTAGRVPRDTVFELQDRSAGLTVDELVLKVNGYVEHAGISGAERVYLQAASIDGPDAIRWDDAVRTAELKQNVGPSLEQAQDQWPGLGATASIAQEAQRGPGM
ncbi:hypothetical protein D3248_01700 [Leucobacter zeae]|nr:hypothetical protein [Leucobacter zeae]